MNRDDLAFYQNLMPVLKQADWEPTDVGSYGKTWWWLGCPDIRFEEIDATTSIGIILYPQRSSLFVQVQTMRRPQQSFTADLQAKAETIQIADLYAQAERAALNLLKENAGKIRAACIAWTEEIDRLKESSSNP